MPSFACKQRSCEPKERTMYMAHKISVTLCVCLLGVGGGGGGGRVGGINIFDTALKNLATNK